MEKATLKTKEVADMLGIPPRRLTDWWQRGKFPGPDIPGRGDRWHRWKRVTVERWCEKPSRELSRR